MEQVFLEKAVIEKEGLTDEGFLAYVALRNRCDFGVDLILYDYLEYQMTGKIESSSISKKIRKGIDNLQELKLVTIVNQGKGKKIELDLGNLFFQSVQSSEKFSPFILINQREIRSIMNSGTKFRERLLRYFVVLIGTINNGVISLPNNFYQKNVGNMSVTYLAKMAGISKSVALDYNKILEDLGLVYICRSKEAIVGNSGQIEKSFTNCYGRPENRETIKEFQAQRESEQGNRGMKNLSHDVNYRRSMKQIYNQIRSFSSNQYDTSIIQEVYNYFQTENENINLKIKKIKQQFKDGIITEAVMATKIAEVTSEGKKIVDISCLEEFLENSLL